MFTCSRENRHGRRRRNGGRRDEAVPPDPRRIEQTIVYVEHHLGITAEQRDAWDRLTDAVRDSADALQTARGLLDEAEDKALAQFAGSEVVADIATAALRRIRPALEGLYGRLDDGQRQTLDELFARRSAHAFGRQF